MRCKWVNLNNKDYVKYHDEEWGVISKDDNYLFEMLVLESFQAGLSWECVLNKRDAFRKAFDNFDYNKVSKYDSKKVDELLNNKDIIRNKLKILAAINNSNVFIKIREEYGSFYNYIWGFTDGVQIVNDVEEVIVSSPLSLEISNDLKRRGMKFVGTTIIYSYLQAIGVVVDHEVGCFMSYRLKEKTE